MDTKDFAGHDGGDGETIEYVDEGFPNLNRRATFAFIVKAVNYHFNTLFWFVG